MAGRKIRIKPQLTGGGNDLRFDVSGMLETWNFPAQSQGRFSSLILSKPRVGFTALSLPRSPPCRRALAPVELSRAFVPLNGAQEEIAFPAAGNGGSSSVVGFRRTALTLPLPSSSNN